MIMNNTVNYNSRIWESSKRNSQSIIMNKAKEQEK